MKQLLIEKNPLIKELSGSRIEFCVQLPEGEKLTVLKGGRPNKVSIPFRAKVMSGGKLDLDFKLSEQLAAEGIQLLGAYWDGQQINAYLAPVENIDVVFGPDVPVIVGTLVQVMTYRQIESLILGGTADTKDGVIVLDMKKEEPKSEAQVKSAKRKKKT